MIPENSKLTGFAPPQKKTGQPQSAQAHAWRDDITGLRALAVIPVLLYHAFPSLAPGGFFGVDVFFVISGYLISGIIFRGLAAGTFSWINFYDKRIRRILPNLFLLLICVLFAGWYLTWPVDFRRLVKHIYSCGFFYENFRLLGEAGYFDVESSIKPLMHLWSLAIEEQFYIVFPLLCMLLWRARNRIRVLGFFIGLFTIASLGSFLFASDRSWAFFFPLARFWELGAGILLAYAQTFRPGFQPVSSKRGRDTLSLFGFILLVALFLLPDAAKDHPGYITIGAVGAAVCLIAAKNNALINRTILSWKPMVFIGLISYSLYLWHWPLLAFINLALPRHALWMRGALLALSFLIATLVYFYVENPARHWKAPKVSLSTLRGSLFRKNDQAGNQWSAVLRQPSVWFLTAVFSLNFFSMFLRSHSGVIPRPYTLPSDFYFAQPQPGLDAKAFHPMKDKYGNAYLHVFGVTEPRLMLAGDSHMDMYMNRAASLAKKNGISFEANTASDCFIFGRPPTGRNSKNCTRKQEQFIALLRNHAVKYVLISQKWGGYFKDNPDFFKKKLTDFARYLEKNPNVRAWIILDPPWEEAQKDGTTGPYNPWKHITRFDIDSKKDFGVRYPNDSRWRDGNETVRRILGTRATYLEAEPYVCKNGKCNLKYYNDDDHLHSRFTKDHAVWIDSVFTYIAAHPE